MSSQGRRVATGGLTAVVAAFLVPVASIGAHAAPAAPARSALPAKTARTSTLEALPSAHVARTGARVLVSGALPQARAVELQELDGQAWRTVAGGESAGGRYALRVPTDEPGIRTYRVVAPASAAGAGVVSAKFPVAVGAGTPAAFSYLTAPPVRWNPCGEPISYRVNVGTGPATALADTKRAVAEIEKATGLRFAYRGTTKAVPGATSTTSVADYHADTDLVVAFSAPGRSAYLAPGRTDLLGAGGVLYDKAPVQAGGASWLRAVRGYVVLDGTQDLPGGFGSGRSSGLLGTWGQVLMHELGHAVGLGHPTRADDDQIMHPVTTNKPARWGAGDLLGLRAVGATQGCLPAPTAYRGH